MSTAAKSSAVVAERWRRLTVTDVILQCRSSVEECVHVPAHACAPASSPTVGPEASGRTLHSLVALLDSLLLFFFNCCLFLFIKERFNQLNQTSIILYLMTETLGHDLHWASLHWEAGACGRPLFARKAVVLEAGSTLEARRSRCSLQPAMPDCAEGRYTVHSSRGEGMQLWILKLCTHTHFIYMYVCMKTWN